MIASLPMYDRPETAGINDALWARIRSHLGFGPDTLSRDLPLDAVWRHPDLVLSQTCGLPYTLDLHPHVTLVGAPEFRLDGCPPGTYCSVIVTRSDETRPVADLLAQDAILNDRKSQSGHNALLRFAQAQGATLGAPQISGGHRLSAQAVAEGRAGIAAIDANTWRMIARWDGFAQNLKVIATTPPTPAMPFICSPRMDAARIAAALRTALSDLSKDDRTALGLYGLVPVSAADYLAVTPPDLG